MVKRTVHRCFKCDVSWKEMIGEICVINTENRKSLYQMYREPSSKHQAAQGSTVDPAALRGSLNQDQDDSEGCKKSVKQAG